MTPQMIDVGKQVRFNRIVNPETGRTVIVPLDHGIILGPVAGIEDPAETVRKVVAGGASAVIFNTGLAPSIFHAYMNRCGAICNLINSITAANELTLISSVESAIRCGADAVSVQVLVGSPHERHMLNNARIVAGECARWSMPLLAMMYPTEEALAEMGTEVELLAARAGAELGADIVKVSYTGDPGLFQGVGGRLSQAGCDRGRTEKGDDTRCARNGRRRHRLRRGRGCPGTQYLAESRSCQDDSRAGRYHSTRQARGRTAATRRVAVRPSSSARCPIWALHYG